jgi:hypothetical protein
MLAEHTFVTTLTDAEALDRGQRFLEALDFEIESRLVQQLTARRGKSRAHRGRIDQLPQRVKLDFDRGRVVLAASIEIHGKSKQLHQDLLLAIARALEANLVRGEDFSAFDELTDVQQRIENDAHHRRVGAIIIIVLVWIFLITIVWMAASR